MIVHGYREHQKRLGAVGEIRTRKYRSIAIPQSVLVRVAGRLINGEALGSVSSNGAPHNIRSRSQEDQPGAEGAMGEGEGSRAETEENDVGGGREGNRGGAESAVGEGEARGVSTESRGAACGLEFFVRGRRRSSERFSQCAGHEVVFSYARSNDKLTKLTRNAQGNARAGTPLQAAKDVDTILLAVHWSRVDDVLSPWRPNFPNHVCAAPTGVGVVQVEPHVLLQSDALRSLACCLRNL